MKLNIGFRWVARRSRQARAVFAGLLALAAGLQAIDAAAQVSMNLEKAQAGPAGTVEDANHYFITQWGPTPYNSEGAVYGYNDCGPAAMLMALTALGIIGQPEPDAASTAIDAVRDAALGFDSGWSERMGFDPLIRAAAVFGAEGRLLESPDSSDIDQAIEGGSILVLGGFPWETWGEQERAAGNYLNSRDPGGHFVALLGKTEGGRYLIGDPLVVNGAIEVTSSQLFDFIASQGFGVLAVSVQSKPVGSAG